MTNSSLRLPIDQTLPEPLVETLIAIRLADVERRSSQPVASFRLRNRGDRAGSGSRSGTNSQVRVEQ